VTILNHKGSGGEDISPPSLADLFSLESYTYDVPEHLIAKYPMEKRDEARLLVVDRKTGSIDESRVCDLKQILQVTDTLIFNDTKVLHALLEGTLPSGRCMQFLLCRARGKAIYGVMAKGSGHLTVGMEILFKEGLRGIIVEKDPEEILVEFSSPITPSLLEKVGSIPLPPYMKRPSENSFDSLRYQTVFAKKYGAVAAPTAGLHFSDDLLRQIGEKGVLQLYLTLHVGTGTFVPIRTANIREHVMHSEIYEVENEVAQKLNETRGNRRIAIGTTALRTLESVCNDQGIIQSGFGTTDLFIYPGYHFKALDALFTNFHTPKSTLLVLVAAFMGYDLMKEVYAKAIEKKFRLFSYGDAMLIL
jgi:S-adenosylmethionine:tRNA ribosyltransferase-isomerase